MAKSVFRDASGRLLNSTEKQAIAKLMKIHQPMMKELEKWKYQREKLETTLFDQIERIGKFLEPYQDPSRVQATLMGLTGQQPKYSSKKSSSKKHSGKAKKRSTKKRR